MSRAIPILSSVWQRMIDEHVPGLAAQTAYYFLLSLFPFLIFTVTLLPYVGITTEGVLELVAQYFPEKSLVLIEDNLRDVLDDRRGDLLSVGVLATIWSASNGINALIRSLNHAYGVEENRNFFAARGIAILLTFAMLFVIVVALLLPVFGKVIGEFFFSTFHLSEYFLRVWNIIRWLISFSVIVSVLIFLYYVAPNKKINWKDVIVGALFATVGWQLSSFAFSFYIDHFANFTATYGGLGGIIILMIWFYLLAFIVIIGGIINAVLHDRRSSGT